MAMLLFSAIIGAVLAVFGAVVKTWSYNQDRTDIRQTGGLAMGIMTRYIGFAGTITAASQTGITFSADVDDDAINETVAFALDAPNKKLNMTIDGATKTLTPYAQGLNLSYCQAGTETTFTPATQADRDNIRVVIISLTVNDGDETITFGSSAYCRNQGLS